MSPTNRLAAASDKVYQLLAQGRWFSPGTPVSSTTKTGRHDIRNKCFQYHNCLETCSWCTIHMLFFLANTPLMHMMFSVSEVVLNNSNVNWTYSVTYIGYKSVCSPSLHQITNINNNRPWNRRCWNIFPITYSRLIITYIKIRHSWPVILNIIFNVCLQLRIYGDISAIFLSDMHNYSA